MFQNKIAYGNSHYPFSLNPKINYDKGICPVVEEMYESKMIVHEMMVSSMSKEDIDDFIKAIDKVSINRSEL